APVAPGECGIDGREELWTRCLLHRQSAASVHSWPRASPAERLGRSERRSRAHKLWFGTRRRTVMLDSPRWPRQTGLDGIRIGASRKQGHHNDFDVEQKRPIIYVVKIALDASPHLLDRISFSAMAVHLGPAGHARIHFMAARQWRNSLRERLVEGDRMRPRANDRHFAQQYIHKLGELVDIRAPQNADNARHARIVLDRLLEVAPIFDRRHRSELNDLDDFIIVPMPGLAEEYGTARIKPNCQRNREQKWRDHQQRHPRDAYVECTLREPIERRQWRVKHLNGDDSAEVGDLGRRPEVARTYRNDMDRDGKLRQSVRCARDSRQVAWRG